jgi:hypothetical protein
MPMAAVGWHSGPLPLLARVPFDDFAIFRNYVRVSEGMQEPAQDVVRQAMCNLDVSYFLYFPEFAYCLFAFHGAISPELFRPCAPSL